MISINFILLLRKGVYAYEYMGDWDKFHEIVLPEKEEFYRNLNMEDVTDITDITLQTWKKEFLKILK